MKNKIESLTEQLCQELNQIDDLESKVDTLNKIRYQIHQHSPFKKHPIDYVEWVKNGEVFANDYNPNAVAPPEMELLHVSMKEDGVTQPIVANKESVTKKLLKELNVLETVFKSIWVIIDGFHRNRVGKEKEDIRTALFGYLPLVQIRKENRARGKRMASTVRHNRARGKHGIKSMMQMVTEFVQMGWEDNAIMKHLGMAKEELFRFKQASGLISSFLKRKFSKSWTEFIEKHDDKHES